MNNPAYGFKTENSELKALVWSGHSSSLALTSHLLAVELITWKRFATAPVMVPLEEIKISCLTSNTSFMVAPEILISLAYLWETWPISQYALCSGSDGWRVKAPPFAVLGNKCSLLCPHARDVGASRAERDTGHYSTEFMRSVSG